MYKTFNTHSREYYIEQALSQHDRTYVHHIYNQSHLHLGRLLLRPLIPGRRLILHSHILLLVAHHVQQIVGQKGRQIYRIVVGPH